MWEIVATLVDMLLFGARAALLAAATVTAVVNFKAICRYVTALFRRKEARDKDEHGAAMFLMGIGMSIGEIMRLVMPILFPHKWVWDFPALALLLALTILSVISGLTIKFIIYAQEQGKNATSYITSWVFGIMIVAVLGVYISVGLERPRNISPLPVIHTIDKHH